MPSIRIAVLVSGSGSNLQSLIDKQKLYFNGDISIVISNVKDAYALQRAKDHGIKTEYISKRDYQSAEEFDSKLVEILLDNEIELIVLAGYLKIMTNIVVDRFKNRIINIHPSLLPSFGGKGYYGLKVHEAVLARGCKVSGATVHFVDNNADTGPIIIQESLNINQDWDASTLQKEVLNIEHRILPKAVKLYCDDRLEVINKRAYIKELP